MDDAELYWRSPGSGSPPPDPFGPLIDVAKGTLQRVVAFGGGTAQDGRLVELLTMEIYDSGAIVRFRSTDPRQPELVTFVGDGPQWIKWRCEISDSQGTRYETVTGGEGHARLWRGEVLVHPAPPDTIEVLRISIRPLHPHAKAWVFEAPIR